MRWPTSSRARYRNRERCGAGCQSAPHAFRTRGLVKPRLFRQTSAATRAGARLSTRAGLPREQEFGREPSTGRMRGRTGSEQMLRPVFRAMRAKAIACAAAAILLLASAWPAAAAEPIKIGFGMALTGGLARNGKAPLLPLPICAQEGNAKSGLPGRPVPPVYYHHHTHPS